jgi:hypothetical protein
LISFFFVLKSRVVVDEAVAALEAWVEEGSSKNAPLAATRAWLASRVNTPPGMSRIGRHLQPALLISHASAEDD